MQENNLYPQPLYNAINIIIDGGDYKDEILVGGKKLYLDPTFHPTHHRKQSGVVVGVPIALTSGNKTSIEVQIGDKVYFHHNALRDQARHQTKDGKTYYRIPYDMLFCAIRYPEVPADVPKEEVENYRHAYKEVVMLNGKALVLPVMNEKVVTESGIVMVADKDAAPVPRKNFGRVVFSGSAKKGFEDPVQPDNLVVMLDSCEYVNEIEGQIFWMVDREAIVAIVEE